MLQPGAAYFVRVRAVVVPAASLDSAPFRRGLPSAEAYVLSAAFTAASP